MATPSAGPSSPPRRAERRLSDDSQTLQTIAEELAASSPAKPLNGSSFGLANGHHSNPSVSSATGGNRDRPRRKTRAVVLLAVSSTASSIMLSFLATRVTLLPLAALPLITYTGSTVLTRAAVVAASWKGVRLDGLGEGWRESWKDAALVGGVGMVALWCRAEAAGRTGMGVLQALDVFIAPILLNLLPRFGLDAAMPAPKMQMTACLLALALSLALLSQYAALPSIILSFIAACFSALHLTLIKRWFASRQTTSPLGFLLRSAPFGMLFSIFPLMLSPSRRGFITYRSSFGGLPRIYYGSTLCILLFLVVDLLALFATTLATEVGNGPVAIGLLTPARNLASLALAPLVGVYTGATSPLQLMGVYILGLTGIVWFDSEVRAALGLVGIDPPPSYSPVGQDPSLPAPATSEVKSPTSQHRRSMSLSYPTFNNPPIDTDVSPMWRRVLNVAAFGPLVLWFAQQLIAEPDGLTGRRAWMTRSGSIDIVFSYYNEPVPDFVGAIESILKRREIRSKSPRIVIYAKNNETVLEDLLRDTNADEVNRLENVGREGATYLTHILRHYNASRPDSATTRGPVSTLKWEGRLGGERVVKGGSETFGLADHTLFMQPHISWYWIAEPRMDMFDAERTGYLSMGPYLSSDCGMDGLGNGNYERMADIYTIFRESFCPPTKQLATYAGQFFVSRRRILANAYSKYVNLLDLLVAPPDHWLHHEGDWFKWQGSTDKEVIHPHSAVTPFLGHAVERSWPVIFGCVDPTIAELCTDDVRNMKGKEICQCFDPKEA